MRQPIPTLLAAFAFLVLNASLWAATPPRTTITLKDLDCPACAKKLATQLAKVQGVAEVKTDLDAKTATVTARPNEQPSPRALWDTTEKAGFEPVKLEGPVGTFTDRPR